MAKKRKKRKPAVRRRRKRRLWPTGIRQFDEGAEPRRVRKPRVERVVEDTEEFELTATTKGWTPRRR